MISEATAASLRRMLEGVLGPGGTASGAAIPGYLLAGKTGTAEKPDPITGGYSETQVRRPRSSASPLPRRRKLLVAVMVDEPQGEIYGGLVAGPAFRDITSFALNYLKIPPDPERDHRHVGCARRYGDVEAVRGRRPRCRTRARSSPFLGPNGAGKTTTVEILEGFRERDGGEVERARRGPGARAAAPGGRASASCCRSPSRPGC